MSNLISMIVSIAMKRMRCSRAIIICENDLKASQLRTESNMFWKMLGINDRVLIEASTDIEFRFNDLVCFSDFESFSLNHSYKDYMLRQKVLSLVITENLEFHDT